MILRQVSILAALLAVLVLNVCTIWASTGYTTRKVQKHTIKNVDNNQPDEACTIRFVHAFIQWQLAETPLSSKLRGYIMDEDGRVLNQGRKKKVLAS